MTEEPPTSPTDRPGFAAPAGLDSVRLQQLARVTSELGSATTMAEVIDAAVAHAASAIAAAVVTLMLRRGSRLELVAGHGLQPGILERWADFDVDDVNPASEAVRTGAVVMVPFRPDIETEYPSLAGQLPASRSIVCLPLGGVPPTVGVLGVTFEDSWLPGPAELAFLTTFAEACGQAVRRIEASAASEATAQSLRFIAAASAELGSSLDYRATLSNVARLSVPELADWCAVDIVDGGEVQTLAVAHVDPAMVQWAWELQRKYPPDMDAPTGLPNVLRTGVAELYEQITDEMLVAGARDEEHLRLSRELHLRSAMVVPLIARGRTLGAITLIRADDERAYTFADLSLAEDLGRRGGVAIDNAHLHEQTRNVALQLQKAVLPADLSDLPGWEIATYYHPGGTAEVGGDFFDAVVLPSGALAVFLGDVMGHGLPAAAAMAHMRAAVRAYLSIEPDPGQVMATLDSMFANLGMTQLVSLVYAVVDWAAGQVTVANAGHYPPLVVDSSGGATWLAGPREPVLGVSGSARTATRWPIAADATILLYTDGLVERRGESIDAGLDRLRLAAAGRLAGGSLAASLPDLVTALHYADGEDDVTALAACPAPEGSATVRE